MSRSPGGAHAHAARRRLALKRRGVERCRGAQDEKAALRELVVPLMLGVRVLTTEADSYGCTRHRSGSHERAHVVVGTGDPCPRMRSTRANLRVERKRQGESFGAGEAMESTTVPSADVHVVCVCGGDVEEGRVVRRRVGVADAHSAVLVHARRPYGAEHCCIQFRRHARGGGNKCEEERDGRKRKAKEWRR
ncbi:hypothetical protein B0H13DRAFT_1898166 [Mycena leptocephala]|nr:hypothetical protein B0H13DRAFT_1898166 [Mycena leptocephala]